MTKVSRYKNRPDIKVMKYKAIGCDKKIYVE